METAFQQRLKCVFGPACRTNEVDKTRARPRKQPAHPYGGVQQYFGWYMDRNLSHTYVLAYETDDIIPAASSCIHLLGRTRRMAGKLLSTLSYSPHHAYRWTTAVKQICRLRLDHPLKPPPCRHSEQNALDDTGHEECSARE